MSRTNFGLICLVSILNQQKNQYLHKDEEEEVWKEMVEKVLVMRMVMELEMRVKRMMTVMRESLLKEDEEWALMLVEIRMMVQYPKMRILHFISIKEYHLR